MYRTEPARSAPPGSRRSRPLARCCARRRRRPPTAPVPDAQPGNALRQAAPIRTGIGTRCIYVNVPGGFDTHSNQLADHADYRPLGEALAAFATDLGGLLDDVVLMVTTEFGRTAAVNGAAGTDHGTGYAMMVLGGRVRGGRVLGRWPGLVNGQLYEGRELAGDHRLPRDLFAEVARKHLGVDTGQLFPGYTPGPGPGSSPDERNAHEEPCLPAPRCRCSSAS